MELDIIAQFTVRATCDAELDNVGAFLFRWSFTDPAAAGLERGSGLMMSALLVVMPIVFTFHLHIGVEPFTRMFLIALGVVGVLSSFIAFKSTSV
jgi:hypothetical protein